MGLGGASLGKAVLELAVDSSQYDQGIADAEDKAGGLGDKLGGLGKLGLAAAVGGIGAVGAGLATATISAAGFERGMRDVNTLIGGDESMFQQMQQDVLNLSKETGIAASEAVPALYQAISSGVPPENVFEFMRASAEAAIGGSADLGDVIGVTTAMVKGYGESMDKARYFQELLQLTVQNGVTTMPELAASMGKVTPVAAAVGVKATELTAAMATLTGVTGNTAEVSTQLRSLFGQLQKPGSDLATVIAELGYQSGEAMVAELGMAGALDAIKSSGDGTVETASKLFGSVEAGTAFLGLAGSQAGKFADNLAATDEVAGNTTAAMEEMNKSTSRQFDILKNSLMVELTRLGLELLPVVNAALAGLTGALARVDFAALTEQAKPVVTVVKDIVLVLAEITATVANHLVPTIQGVIGLFSGMTEPTKNVVAALRGLGDSVTTQGAIVGNAVSAMSEAWTTHFAPITAQIRTAVDEILPLFAPAVQNIADLVLPILRAIAGFFQANMDAVNQIVDAGLAQVALIFSTAIEVLSSIIIGLLKLLAGDWEGALKELHDIADAMLGLITGSFENWVAAITGVLALAWAALPENFRTAASNAVTGFVEGLTAGIERVKVAVTGFATSIVSTLKGALGIASPSTVFAAIAGDAMGGFLGGINEKAGAVLERMGTFASDVVGKVASLKDKMPTEMSGALDKVNEVAGPILTTIGTLFSGKFGVMATVVNKLRKVFDDVLLPVFETLKSTAGPIIENLRKAFDDHFPKIEKIISALVSIISTEFMAKMTLLGGLVTAILKTVAGDFEGAKSSINTTLENVKGLFSNLGTHFGTVVDSIGKLVGDFPAKLGTALVAWGKAFMDWIDNTGPTFLEKWPVMLSSFLTVLGENAGPILKKLAEWTLSFVSWIISDLIPALAVNLPKIAFFLLQFIGTTAGELAKAILLEWIPAIVNWVITDAWPKLDAALTEMGVKLGAAIRAKATQVFLAARDLVVSFVQAFAGLPGEMVQVGKDIVQGLIDGLAAMLEKVRSMATEIRNIASDALNKVPGVEAARSKVAEAGSFIGNVAGNLNPFTRQAGGDVWPGQAFLVGEAGPELFVPHSSGTIIPNGQLAAGGMVYAPQITVMGSVWGADLEDILVNSQERLARQGRN